MRIEDYPKCFDCIHYDPSPFPEYHGKLAICDNPDKDFVGSGKIGRFTIASKRCFEKKEST